jgi:hypothetical protein
MKINQYLKEIFYVSGAAIIIFCLMEFFWPGIVLAYININWLLICWLLVGILILYNSNAANK